MDARAGRRQPAVALVGDEHDGAGLGDGEVGAGDAHVGRGETSRAAARRPSGASATRVVRQRLADVFRQDAGDALARVMDRRGDQVRRPFAGQLDDELAEVGLRHLQAGRLQGRVEVDFLGGHRLRFDDAHVQPALRAMSTTMRARPRPSSAAQWTWPPRCCTDASSCSR